MADSQLIQGAGQAYKAEGVGKLAASTGATAVAGFLAEGLGKVFQKRNREWNSMMKTQLNKEGLTDEEYQALYQKFKERRGAYVYLNKKDRAAMERDLMKDASNYKKKEGDIDDIVDSDVDPNDLGPGLTDDINGMVDGTKKLKTDKYGRVGYSLRSDALKEFVVEDENGNNVLLSYSAAWDDDRFTVSKDGKFKTDKFGNKYENNDEGKAKFTRDAKLYWIRKARETGNKLLHYNSTTGKREYLTPDEAEALINSPDKFVTLDEIKDHINGKAPDVKTNNSVQSVLQQTAKNASNLKDTDSLEFDSEKTKNQFSKIITSENVHKLARDKTIMNGRSWEQNFVESLTSNNYKSLGIDSTELENMDPTPDDKITKEDANAIKNAVMEDDNLLTQTVVEYFTLAAKREHDNNIPKKQKEKNENQGGDDENEFVDEEDSESKYDSVDLGGEYNYQGLKTLSVSSSGGQADILENGKKITIKNAKTGNVIIPEVNVDGVVAKGTSIVVNASMGGSDAKFNREFGEFKVQGGKDYPIYKWFGDEKNMKIFNDNATAQQKEAFNRFIRTIESDPVYAKQLLEHIKSGSGTISAATLK